MGRTSFVENKHYKQDRDYLAERLAQSLQPRLKLLKSKLQEAPREVRDHLAIPRLKTFFSREAGHVDFSFHWELEDFVRQLSRLDTATRSDAENWARDALAAAGELWDASGDFIYNIPRSVDSRGVILNCGRPPTAIKPQLVAFGFSAMPITGHYLCPRCGAVVVAWDGNVASGSEWIRCPNSEHPPVFFVEDCLKEVHGLSEGVHRLRRTKKHYEVYQQIFTHAQRENSSFHRLPWERYRLSSERVYVFVKDKQVVGYSQWNDFDDLPCVRQIYTTSPCRRKGIATTLLRVEGEHTEKFYVESPNDASTPLLVKLGYLTQRGDSIRNAKATVISCG